jgi:branched-subunit amino acid transport protein
VADGAPWEFAVVLAGAAATFVWRALGVALSGRLSPDSPLLDLVGYIAYGLLAALIARMILLPIGPLQGVGLDLRLAATAIAVLVFFALRRNLLAGVAAGGGALALLSAGWRVFG